MKICHVTDFLPGYHSKWGGAEQACYRLLRGLKEQGHQVSVLATQPVNQPAEDLEFFSVRTISDYLNSKITNFLKIAIMLCIPFDPISFLHSYRLLKKIKPDILHLHKSKDLSFALAQSARILGIPVIVTIYDYWCLCPKETLIDKKNDVCRKIQGPQCIDCSNCRLFKWLRRRYFPLRNRFFSRFLKQVNALVVLSESSANILQHYGSEKTKIHVIRQTSLPKEEELRKKETIEQGSILYVGWLQHRKGLHVIIKAMPKILRSVPEAKLYIIGEVTEEDKQYLNELEHLIKREGLENRVLFLGKKPYEEVKEFLRKSQVVVIPEQWENMSPVILVEAMAFAKPVVASRIGGIPEFIDDNRNGLLVEPHNLSDFTKKVVLLLKNGAYAAKIGETASKDIIKLCDQKQSLKKLLDLYNSF